MLFKKIKILFLITVYSVFLLLVFSESFLSDFQEIRRSVLIELRDKKTATLFIPKATWDSFSDIGEFEYQGDYYDTKSFVCQNEMVKVEVIKDSFEIILKSISKTSHSKSKKSHPLKVKKAIDFYISKISSLDLFQNSEKGNPYYNYPFKLQNNYLFSLFRPPLVG